MRLKPLHDWAVLIPVEAGERSAGGLFLPDSAKEKPAEGIVESIGPGAFEQKKPGKAKAAPQERKFVPTTVKPGDRVLYERWAGQRITAGGEERVVVREASMLGWLPGSAKPAAEAGPLQLPAKTGGQSETSLARLAMTAITATATGKKSVGVAPRKASAAPSKPEKKAVKKAAKKAVKKTVKKAVKKAAQRSAAKVVKKSAPKKAAAKKAKAKPSTRK